MRTPDEHSAQWEQRLNELFDGIIPERAEWTKTMQIADVLDRMAGDMNHFYFPNGGGQNLGICRSSGSLVEWSNTPDSRRFYVSRPIKLTFWSPGQTTREANFVLEVGDLESCIPDEPVPERGIEEVVELGNGESAARSAWDSSEHEGEELPDTARLLVRMLRAGRFALFSKGAYYARMREGEFNAYSGKHSDPVWFESVVTQLADA